jgi:STE24 endopeptidase
MAIAALAVVVSGQPASAHGIASGGLGAGLLHPLLGSDHLLLLLGVGAASASLSAQLLLWGLAVTALVTWVIVRTGLLERVERRLRRRGPNLRAFVIAVVFLGVSALLSLPWTLYESWWREKSYGRTSQPLADFLGQGAIALLLSAVLGALFMTGVYALIRRAGRTWWIWSAGLTAIAMSALLLAAPIVIEPLFNEFKPVPAGPVRDAVAEIARRREGGPRPR